MSFDVTSFEAEDGSSIDPFGTGFEIFFDGPMLKLAAGDNAALEGQTVKMFWKDDAGEYHFEEKPKLEDLGNGRFVYRVDPDRAKEAGFWTGKSPMIVDAKAASTDGERKTIVFRNKNIVSSGDLVVSANPDHVTFHSKTFAVSNTPIQGRIGYLPTDAVEPIPVPADQFVSFSRIFDDSRIGLLIVKAINENVPDSPTTYELRLRGEYEFYWENDPIKMQTQVDGHFYSIVIPDLKTLYSNRTIILELEK